MTYAERRQQLFYVTDKRQQVIVWPKWLTNGSTSSLLWPVTYLSHSYVNRKAAVMVGLIHSHARKFCDLLLGHPHLGAKPTAVFLCVHLRKKLSFLCRAPYVHAFIVLCSVCQYIHTYTLTCYRPVCAYKLACVSSSLQDHWY